MAIKYKDDSNTSSDYAAMLADHISLTDMMTALSVEFSNIDFILTHINRGYIPNYKTYADLIEYFKNDVLTPANKGTYTVDQINAKFFYRCNDGNPSSGKISHNEWIYKDVIMESSNPLSDKKFTKYSAHIVNTGEAYGAAIDISTDGITKAKSDAIIAFINKNYPDMWIENHCIDGGAVHLHVQDNARYNIYKDKLISEINAACGYGTAASTLKTAAAGTGCKLINDQKNIIGGTLTAKDCQDLVQTDITEQGEQEQGSPNVSGEQIHEIPDTRSVLPSEIDENGLMDVLAIGDIDFSLCPVAQISYSQSMQFMRFSTLRTVGDPKIATETVPNNITLNIIFPNAAAINDELESLISIFMVAPVVTVQSRFISRVLKPLIVDHKGSMVQNPFSPGSPDDESIWMIMTDMNVRSIPEFPEAFEAFVTLEVFEDRVFGSPMTYLVDKKDLVEKYRKKSLIFDGQYALPSDKSMIKTVKNYKPGVINVTGDPNSSKLYRQFYSDFKTTFGHYSVTDQNLGVLKAIYNIQDFSRQTIRTVKKQMEEAYNQTLKETAKILKYAPVEVSQYLQSQGIQPILPSQIQEIASGMVSATVSQLALAVQASSISKTFQGLRYATFDSAFKFRAIIKDADQYGKNVFQALNVPETLRVGIMDVFLSALGQLGSIKNYTDALFSPTALKNALKNPPGSQDIGMVDGVGGALEVLMGTKLFAGIDLNGKDAAKNINDRAKLVSTALNQIANLCLTDPKNTDNQDLDADGMPQFPNKYAEAVLVDGVNSFITGLSFSINNKVVPQQVIGWREPTYQHLGRSDWSINMSIICKGDEAINQIMYIMNRLGILSKQIQYSSPAKFLNLDTVLHITEGDPIFSVLGIESIALTTVEISSVPGQPNVYQMNLGMEQSDLDIFALEKLGGNVNKDVNTQANKAILGQLVPVLKAFISSAKNPYYGRFLDFLQIKDVITDPNLNSLWVAFGMGDVDGKSQYDYMDKYCFYKMILGETNITDPTKNWDLVLKALFPTTESVFNFNVSDSVLQQLSNKSNLPGSQINDIKKAFKSLNELVKKEANGDLLWAHGTMKSSEKLALSMEPYFEGIQDVVNAWLNHCTAIHNAPSTFFGNPGAGGGTGLVLGAGAALGTAALVFALTTNPLGWAALLILFAVMSAEVLGGGALGAAQGGLNAAKQNIQATTLPKVLPSIFNIAVNQKVIDVVKEFICDQSTLDLFNSDFQLGTTADGKVITLQNNVQKIRDAIGSSLDGCYNDFNTALKNISQTSKIPLAILDPAFYLYADDFITIDLIREAKMDIQNQMTLLVTRANINAMQLGSEIDDKYKLDKSLNFTSDTQPPPSDIITKQDMQWVVDIKRNIDQIMLDTFKQPSVSNLTKMQNMQTASSVARDIYFDEKYWDSNIVANKTNAALELAFSRLTLINAALRFDVMKQTLDNAAVTLQRDMANITNGASNGQTNSSPLSDPTKTNAAKAYKEYCRFFKDQSVERKFFTGNTNLGIAGEGNLTWYQAIIIAGSIDNPFYKTSSINSLYCKMNGNCKSMKSDFTDPRMVEIIEQTDIIARAKKASTNPVSAEMMAKYNALTGDPKMLEKRVDEIQSVQDIVLKSSIMDNSGSPARIFPTYKLYFIEENAPEWGIFNDFYDYSAVQEITVVKDRNSASDICTIRLSNVTGKLTDTFSDNLPHFGANNLPPGSIMLKPGVSILVKMGYSNSQVELPVVFYGIIVEVNPGPVVEVVCQGYGAELNELVAPNEGVHFGFFGTIKALGDVATWALQQATGLNHFGKLDYTNFGIRDSLRLSGGDVTGMQGNMKIASFITGLPGLSVNDPRDDNVFLPYNVSHITDAGINGTIDGALKWISDKLNTQGNLQFKWYIRDMSIWDVISELTVFSPDFIRVVLPYNDNLFPFVPNIRNTLYVGPRKGYYKYTDMFSLISKSSAINVPNAPAVANLLFNIGKMGVAIEYKIDLTKYGIPGVTLFSNANLKYQYSLIDSLDKLLVSDSNLLSMVNAYFNINYVPNIKSTTTNEVVHDENESYISGRDLGVKFLDLFTNYPDVSKQIVDVSEQIDANYGEQVTSIANLYDTITINRDFTTALKKAINQDIGLNGIYYNLYGTSHQYRKVQQHHIATAYTNIINNNIIASAEGWANQIKLIFPEDPQDYKSKEDVTIKDRESLLTQVFNLDDNILDDQIRTKEIFINNVNPSVWDDSYWASKAIKGEASYSTVQAFGNSSDGAGEYATFKDDGSPIVKNIPDDINNTDTNIKKRDGFPDETYNRQSWELMPARWRIGVSLLAQEARDMYNGELVITGNASIRPYDIVHIIDYVNDMHGAVEVGRVIHTISPQTGFVTRIKPDLIVNQKNRFNADELFVVSKMYRDSYVSGGLSGIRLGLAGGAGILGGTSLIGSAAALFEGAGGAATATSLAITTLGSVVGWVALAGLVAYGGYKIIKGIHERTIMMMNNIIGRDSLEILPLTYRGLPYVAGVEGIKKENYMRHMYSMAIDSDSKLNIFERMGYMNAPMEYEYYRNVAKASPVFAWIETNLFNPISKNPGSSVKLGTLPAIFKGIASPGEQ